MQSKWSDDDAETIVRHYAERGVNRDLALRVYTSRLLGRDKRLVLHGGGNTSVKTLATDLIGDAVEVLCVKGSGWDMGAIEPAGLPAVRLAPLRRLRARESLSDEDMVNFQRTNLIDAGAPNPSVETLLHAFLPHKYIDHTHSTAVLSLADQPDCAEACRAIYGSTMGLVPYIMPGFALAKKAAEIYEDDPSVEGLILLKHGIFTFGATAREAYERMIAMVSLAEERVASGRRRIFSPGALPDGLAAPAEIAPIIRGACAIADPAVAGAYRRFVLDFRSDPAILAYVSGAERARYSQSGVATPDHTIRTKNYPLLVPPPAADDLASFKADVVAAVARFTADYHAYFARQNPRHDNSKRELDPLPRVVLVPGVGLFGLGRSARDAAIAADLAECTIETVAGAEAIGRFESIPEIDLFDTGRSSRPSSARARRSRSPARSPSSPAAAARSARRRQGCSAGTARRSLFSTATARRRRRSPRASAAVLWRSPAMSPLRTRCAPPSMPSQRASAASTSSSPMPAPPGRAA